MYKPLPPPAQQHVVLQRCRSCILHPDKARAGSRDAIGGRDLLDLDRVGRRTQFMVSASKGVLVQCDVQTKVFIMSLGATPNGQKIVLRELDDNNLLINPQAVEFVKEELQRHNDANTYVPPVTDKRL